jgi:N-acetylglucosaminyl-diphospho-decaprenol L-rhamnosyltransferase
VGQAYFLKQLLNENMIDLSIVIITYNCKGFVFKCIESIFAQDREALQVEVIVVDNASEDGTVGAIAEAFPNVRLIKNDENRWFTRALNQGIRESCGRYILSLNPDTCLLTLDGLSKIVQYLDTHPKVGILGVQLFNPDGTIQADCERFPGLAWVLCYYFLIHKFFPSNPVWRYWRYGDWDRKDTRIVDYVSGACMIIRRRVFDEVGLFDENYIMYWEEGDFCRIAHKAGWQTVHLAEVEIMHHWRGCQKNISANSHAILAQLCEKGMLYYYRKYYGVGVYRILLTIFRLRQIISKMKKYPGLFKKC